jgi:hypothetical protein
MDIDNMARDAFQTDEVSEHCDLWEFDTGHKISIDKDMFVGDKREITWGTFMTYSSLVKMFVCIVLAFATVSGLRSNCF